MTLGEFRKYTANLDDSIELSYHYAVGYMIGDTINEVYKDYKG